LSGSAEVDCPRALLADDRIKSLNELVILRVMTVKQQPGGLVGIDEIESKPANEPFIVERVFVEAGGRIIRYYKTPLQLSNLPLI
jgi:hypothetical protein